MLNTFICDQCKKEITHVSDSQPDMERMIKVKKYAFHVVAKTMQNYCQK